MGGVKPNRGNYKNKRLSTLQKKRKAVSRAYGGNLCHQAVRLKIIRAFLSEETRIASKVRKAQRKRKYERKQNAKKSRKKKKRKKKRAKKEDWSQEGIVCCVSMTHRLYLMMILLIGSDKMQLSIDFDCLSCTTV